LCLVLKCFAAVVGHTAVAQLSVDDVRRAQAHTKKVSRVGGGIRAEAPNLLRGEQHVPSVDARIGWIYADVNVVSIRLHVVLQDVGGERRTGTLSHEACSGSDTPR
jgi:hypothetical protein